MGKNQRLAVLARHTSAEPAAADAYTYPPLDLPAEVDATEKVSAPGQAECPRPPPTAARFL